MREACFLGRVLEEARSAGRVFVFLDMNTPVGLAGRGEREAAEGDILHYNNLGVRVGLLRRGWPLGGGTRPGFYGRFYPLSCAVYNIKYRPVQPVKRPCFLLLEAW